MSSEADPWEIKVLECKLQDYYAQEWITDELSCNYRGHVERYYCRRSSTIMSTLLGRCTRT